jgi:hypothetical protein
VPKTSDERSTGPALRRKVRRITMGIVGASVVGAATLTVGLAVGTDAAENVSDTSAASVSTAPLTTVDPTGTTTATTSAADPAARSTTAALAAPTQAPTATGGVSQVQSGGS